MRVGRARLDRLAGAAALLLLGCGEGLLDTTFRGEPLFAFEGQIVDYFDPELGDAELRVSLFWVPGQALDVAESALTEQHSVSVAVSFPSAFRINVFQPPSTALGDPNAKFHVGLIRVFTDRDGSGGFTPDANPREMVGGAVETVLLYVPRALAAADSPTNRDLPAGFHLGRLPLPCGDEPFALEPVDTCGVPLGAECKGDGDCNGGVCLAFDGIDHYPGGYCTLYDSGPCGDLMLPGMYVYDDVYDEHFAFLEPCSRDEDCRVAEGYLCDPVVWACAPDAPVALSIPLQQDYEVQFESYLCVDDMPWYEPEPYE